MEISSVDNLLDATTERRLEVVLEYFNGDYSSMTEFAEDKGVSPPTISQHLGNAEDEGLVEKTGWGSYKLVVDREILEEALGYGEDESSNKEATGDGGHEIYEDLRDSEMTVLYGVLVEGEPVTIAEHSDLAETTVREYTRSLVEKGYLRDLQPGRGSSEYIPGKKLEAEWDSLERYVLLDEIEPSMLGDAFDLIRMVDEKDKGFGIISDKVDEACRLSRILIELGIVEEVEESPSGLQVTEKGEKYLGLDTGIDRTTKNRDSQDITNNSRSRKNANRGSRRKRGRSNGEASDELLDIGRELMEGHEMIEEQAEDWDIDTRDLTDSEGDVQVEDENAGYEGFT